MCWLEHTGGRKVHDQAVVAQRFARKSATAAGSSHYEIKTVGEHQ